jgi:hypothetical protein
VVLTNPRLSRCTNDDSPGCGRSYLGWRIGGWRGPWGGERQRWPRPPPSPILSAAWRPSSYLQPGPPTVTDDRNPMADPPFPPVTVTVECRLPPGATYVPTTLCCPGPGHVTTVLSPPTNVSPGPGAPVTEDVTGPVMVVPTVALLGIPGMPLSVC